MLQRMGLIPDGIGCSLPNRLKPILFSLIPVVEIVREGVVYKMISNLDYKQMIKIAESVE